MKTQKISLENMQGKLSREDMKMINGGLNEYGGSCYTSNGTHDIRCYGYGDNTPHQVCCYSLRCSPCN